VRRRAAIKGPWREYRREGNSLFLFSLAVIAIVMVIVSIAVGLCFFVAVMVHIPPDQQIFWLIAAVGLGFGAYIFLVTVCALIGYFVPMVMYRHRCGALEGCKAVLGLMWADPGAFALFGLFGIGLFIGWLITATIVTCATCCSALLPYVGTVLMLPVFLWFRSYGLLFLRQFGPEWDVWAGAAPFPPPLPPITAVTT
jgi:hypothetical protein